MAHDERIYELVEEVLETKRTPDEVCAQHPELLGEVKAQLRRLRAISAQVDSLFPPAEFGAKTIDQVSAGVEVALPSIPDYEVQLLLGRGGMGVVYKARHLKLSRNVALKMLLTGAYASPQEHHRFVREAESVAALRHPNIVQIYEFGDVDGHPFYTMEYIDGGSLAEKLAGKIQPARESAQLASLLARAVQVAHESGILHRDLKPANILLAEDGAPKIADFGLARRLDRESGLTHTGARVGTPSYMAPEQMAGNASLMGPGIDVFALGAIIYEMLTGRPPFRGETLSDTERKLATEDPAPPSRINAKVPRDLETICLKCLEKEPHNRYSSAGDLAADLDRFLQHEPIRARPVAPLERATRWVRRNPLLAALAVTGILLIGVIVGDALQETRLATGRRAEKARLMARFDSGVQLVQDGRYAEARAILEKLGDGGFADLRQRIDRAVSELGLVEELDAVGIKRSMVLNSARSQPNFNAEAAKAYAAIFARSQLGRVQDSSEDVAQRIRNSDIRGPLVASLDDWALCEPSDDARNWVLAVARQADPDLSGWRNRIRDPDAWNQHEALKELIGKAHEQDPSVQLLRVLGDRMTSAGFDATAFCNQVQVEHPDSFLANLALANALRTSAPAESMRYYQAALAIRPQSATAHNNLGVALSIIGRSDEAIVEFDHALRLDEKSTQIPYNLGLELYKAKRVNEAIPQFQEAITRAPALAEASESLAIALMDQQKFADAKNVLTACLNALGDDAVMRPAMVELLEQCKAAQAHGAERPAE